jgi:phosphate transport system permease protein
MKDPIPRYQISAASRRIDRAMTHFIKIGGIGIILAVFGIFLFILSQIFPLFQGASVQDVETVAFPPDTYVALGTDEWTERPFALTRQGDFVFMDLAGGGGTEVLRPVVPSNTVLSAVHYRPAGGFATVGTATGTFAFVEVVYATSFEGGERQITPRLDMGAFYPVGQAGAPIVQLAHAVTEHQRMVAVVQEVAGRREVYVADLAQRRSLMGATRLRYGRSYALTPLIEGEPTGLLVNSRCDSVLVLTDQRTLHYLFLEDGAFVARQRWQPFDGEAVASVDFLLGDDSVVVTSASGGNRVYSLSIDEATQQRLFGLSKTMAPLPGPATTYAVSLRNKAFLLAGDGFASLRYSTTESIRWQAALPLSVRQSVLSGKYDRMLLLDEESVLHVFRVEDPHPEASFRAFFSKLWYEGASEPQFVWQSTGGTDDFEAKLSMVPLIIGTLKGTLYAMLFSVPLALMAALYTSQFAVPGMKRYIKPLMEIMASLPSVILGFLAALWLAPLLETRVPSVLLMLVLVPLVVLAFGSFWGRLPFVWRRRIPDGAEMLAVMPLIVAGGYLGWIGGPWLEQVMFVAQDSATGAAVADFRMWWPQVTGLPFEQRNSLVVGFIMGFAVIPIIFTITEDALSNVPPSFRSSSLALGASRWQTAMRVVLPTASAGIFSAIMIGFGRAVGETMIVLMATGNTPIMDWNIFSGMRTLSANIAVELPEAPHHGTLYRTLFLGSMLLFLMTFTINTFAEMLRHHLREKYKAI